MPTEKYSVQFKLAGGAKVTKIIQAASVKDATTRAVKKFKAKEILEVRRVT